VLLKLSLHQPHYPYHTTEEKFTWYLNRVRPFVDQPVSTHPALSRKRVEPGVDVSEREIRRAIAAYYGMIETVDDYVGDMMAALRRVGEDLDDWIVVYTTDHGEMLGEHGVWEKQKFYEASARVPLIIRWPKRIPGGRVVNENVNLCDLFATLCDLAGVAPPGGLDSRSLVPLMDGDASDWDNETISQFGTEHLMIKRDALKYQFYGSDGPEVLFDLDRDPGECEDVSGRHEYAEAMVSFRRRAADLGYAAQLDQPD
jgi:choline-sulfatase